MRVVGAVEGGEQARTGKEEGEGADDLTATCCCCYCCRRLTMSLVGRRMVPRDDAAGVVLNEQRRASRVLRE
jgi:hypothetical protein